MSPLRPSVVLSAAWFLAVLAAYHLGPEGYPASRPASVVLDLLMLSLVLAAAWGLGSLLTWRLRLAESSPGEAVWLEIGAGLGGLALAVFLLAAAGLLYRPVILALLAGCLLPLGVTARRPPASAPAGPEPRPGWERLLVTLTGVAGAATLAASLAPPEFYDALVYHLAVPELYLRRHGLVPVEGNFYASYPANMGMLYAVGLSLRGGELAQSIHWLCGALTAGALFASARRHTDRPTAVLACALFSLTPGLMLVSTYAIADLGVTLFATLCFASVLNLWRDGDRRWLVTAGIFAGLACGTKYTAIAIVAVPAALAVALRPPRGRRGLVEAAAVLGLAGLLLSFWLARNLAFTGNPLAPYFDSGGGPGLGQELSRRLPSGSSSLGLAMHYALSPWNVTMDRLGAGGYLGPLFLMLLPALPFLRGLPRVVPPAALLAGAGFTMWALSSQVTRYLFPVVPLLALLAAVASRRMPRAVAAAGISWALLHNLSLFFLLVETIGSYRVLTGAEPREAYLARRVSYYPAAEYLAEAPAGARLLLVGEGRGFYCPRDYVASTPFDAPALERYASRAAGERELLDVLRRDGITHLLVSDPELRRTRGLTADEIMRRHFPSGAPRLLFERNGVRVYGLPG